MKSKAWLAAGLALTLTFAAGAARADCAGFTDVELTSSFCPNVEWLKNRNITTGCTAATLYCPTDNVTRLAMAAFMNRLGTALTPSTLFVEADSGAIANLTTEQFVCQTADFAVTGFPRRAIFNSTFSFTSNSGNAIDVSADPWFSLDSGATWSPANTFVGRATSNTGADWAVAVHAGALDLNVGASYRFALRLLKRGGVATGVATSRCHLLTEIQNRNGTSTPFDTAKFGQGDQQ
jgi:hypothetical protein